MARFRRKSAAPARGTTPRGGSQEPTKQGRVEQVRAVWKLTRENDPRTIPLVIGPALAVLAILVVVGVLIGHIIIFAILGVLGAMVAGSTIFGRRATASMFSQVEGRAGAAAAVLQGMRGDWRVTPAVAFTRNQDLVHRVIGRPGVVLVAEGSSSAALRQLIVDQKRRVGRVAPDTPTYDVVVGDGEGQVPIRKLQQHMIKLPRNLKSKEIETVESRMRAIGGTNMPMPKGPLPTRVPRGKIR
jgi:xanthosine utilization system XapX-like protein